ncbi:MAG: hypothetical protein JHD28_04380, partial [Bacteroidia bacterium]|nr:hypothetical protein [Bacteroidia bacterium]
ENGNGNGGGGGNGASITAKGTVVYQGCGLSIYGKSLWIKLDDGTLLQPCAQSFQTLCPIILNEGDRVDLKYSKYKGDMKSFEIYCKIAYFPFTRATIDFINVLNDNNCKIIDFPANYDQLNTANINITSANIEGSKLNLNIGFSGCGNNAKQRFKLIAKPTVDSDMMTYEIKLTDEKVEMCEAYFTDNICFDIAPMKHLIDGKVRIRIVGFDKEFIF